MFSREGGHPGTLAAEPLCRGCVVRQGGVAWGGDSGGARSFGRASTLKELERTGEKVGGPVGQWGLRRMGNVNVNGIIQSARSGARLASRVQQCPPLHCGSCPRKWHDVMDALLFVAKIDPQPGSGWLGCASLGIWLGTWASELVLGPCSIMGHPDHPEPSELHCESEL